MSDSPDRPEPLAEILRELLSLTRKTDLDRPAASEDAANDRVTEDNDPETAPTPGVPD